MTSRSRRSVEKEKVSYVFMSLRRRALQAHVCTATWSWTCCSAALIIVSPLTDRNRSEAWLLPECKQSSSQKSFLFFISLLADPPPCFPTFIAPHPALLSHSATASTPLLPQLQSQAAASKTRCQNTVLTHPHHLMRVPVRKPNKNNQPPQSEASFRWLFRHREDLLSPLIHSTDI